MVNGQYQLALDIAEGPVQRWRICNSASTFSCLRLTGHDLQVINVDGDTPAATVPAEVLIIAPGGRVDALVRGGRGR